MIKAARITAPLKIRGLVGFASNPNVPVRAVLHKRSFESHASLEPCANFSSQEKILDSVQILAENQILIDALDA
jgi:hypothetical protein